MPKKINKNSLYRVNQAFSKFLCLGNYNPIKVVSMVFQTHGSVCVCVRAHACVIKLMKCGVGVGGVGKHERTSVYVYVCTCEHACWVLTFVVGTSWVCVEAGGCRGSSLSKTNQDVREKIQFVFSFLKCI